MCDAIDTAYIVFEVENWGGGSSCRLGSFKQQPANIVEDFAKSYILLHTMKSCWDIAL
jgi:hypothetical protein